jgi:hypothetical protein
MRIGLAARVRSGRQQDVGAVLRRFAKEALSKK